MVSARDQNGARYANPHLANLSVRRFRLSDCVVAPTRARDFDARGWSHGFGKYGRDLRAVVTHRTSCSQITGATKAR